MPNFSIIVESSVDGAETMAGLVWNSGTAIPSSELLALCGTPWWWSEGSRRVQRTIMRNSRNSIATLHLLQNAGPAFKSGEGNASCLLLSLTSSMSESRTQVLVVILQFSIIYGSNHFSNDFC